MSSAALWVTKLDDENDQDYLRRTAEEAKGAPLTWRRGDGNDLGYHCKEEDITDKSWAVWGVPAFNGPGMVEEWLGQQGWTLKTRPQPPRSRGSPWKIYGLCNEKQSAYAYQVEIDGQIRRLSIVPWKSSRKLKEETFQVSGPRWFSEHFQYEEVGPTQVLEPTQIDMEDAADDGNKITSPPKKKVKPSKLRGGEPGPEGLNLRTLEDGGNGDCGWRSIAFQLAAINSKSSNLADSVMSKISILGKALRSQALFHLCEVDLEWKKHWVPDDAWNHLTEDGPPAQDLETFAKDTLHRDNRWICHYGLMAVSAVKKVHLIMWQYKGDEKEPWSKIAVISPSDEKKRLPIIHLAKDGGHYMPLISDTMQKPDYSLLENSAAWTSKGIQSKSPGEKKDIFRAGGKEDIDNGNTSNRGGIDGPKGMHLRTLDLGGVGDCAFNARQGKLINCVLPKIDCLAKILRSQAMHFLCEVDQDWKESWAPEDTWSFLTEDGPPAIDLHTFMTETLHRENRWICRFGLFAAAESRRST